jgi:hypothetical protein
MRAIGLREILAIARLLGDNLPVLLEAWHEHFG